MNWASAAPLLCVEFKWMIFPCLVLEYWRLVEILNWSNAAICLGVLPGCWQCCWCFSLLCDEPILSKHTTFHAAVLFVQLLL